VLSRFVVVGKRIFVDTENTITIGSDINTLTNYNKATKHFTSNTPLHTIIYINAKSSIFTEQYNQCGNSTEESQTPHDGYINVRNMLIT